MKQKEVFKKIGGILKELNDQYEYLKSAEGELNELELELFLANSHFLTDHLLILSKLNLQNNSAQKSAEKTEASHEQKYFEPLVQPFTAPVKNAPGSNNFENKDYGNYFEDTDEVPVSQTTMESDDTAGNYPLKPEEPETIRHELILDEADWGEDEADEHPGDVKVIDEDEIEIPPLPEKQVVTVVKEELRPVAEVPVPALLKQEPKTEVLTINEKISAQLAEKNAGIAGQLHLQPITDLKPAINLNDKLLFIKELFNGYSLAYSEAIEILNRFNTFEEAELFLNKNYVTKNHWESKAETTAKLYDLLKRRYA